MLIHIHQLPVVIYRRVVDTSVGRVTGFCQEHMEHKQEEKLHGAGKCTFVNTFLQSTRRHDFVPV